MMTQCQLPWAGRASRGRSLDLCGECLERDLSLPKDTSLFSIRKMLNEDGWL